ncbi:hypothetical protein T265_15445, partial [Opisthorchis viverrini]
TLLAQTYLNPNSNNRRELKEALQRITIYSGCPSTVGTLISPVIYFNCKPVCPNEMMGHKLLYVS